MAQAAAIMDDSDELDAASDIDTEVDSRMVNEQFAMTNDPSAFFRGETVSFEKFLDFIEDWGKI